MLCAADASGNGGSDACQVDVLDHHDVDGSREGCGGLTVNLMITLAVMLKAMFQGDSGGPLVACGPDGNCGTTAGMNYDLIGGLSSSSPSSSSSSSLFMSLYHKQECVLDSQIANIKLVTQVLCPLELAVPRLTSQASTQGCRLPDDEDLCLLCTMFNTLKASVITFRNDMSILIILRQGDRGQAMD